MKTDRQLVEDCNRLAHELYRLHGFRAPDSLKFWEAMRDREKLMWALAVKAYEEIEGTPIEDALTNLEDDPIPDFVGMGI